MRAWVLLALVLAMGCSKKDETPASEAGEAAKAKVRVQLNWVPEPEFGGLYAALEGGLYAEAGLDVELIKGSAGVPSAQLAASGKVDFGVVTGAEVVKLRARGAPLVAVYAQFLKSPRALVVHAASPHRSLEALWKSEAKVLAEPGHTFVKWLDRQYGGEGLSRLPSAGNLAGFMADEGLAQAVFVFAEPVELARREVAVRVLDVADTGFNPYEAVLATREGYLAENADVARRFVEATRAGWAAYLADPGPTNAVMAKLNPAMSAEAMATAAGLIGPYVRGEGGPLGEMKAARWQTLVEQLTALGEVEAGKAPTAEACFRTLGGG